MKSDVKINSTSILKLGQLDHYTLIVDNATKATEFHCNILGFRFKEEKLINTGTVAEGEYDMVNHILNLPDNEDALCVITEGLNDSTVFRKYLKKYGEGIHHVAYRSADLNKDLKLCKDNKIETTSQEIIHDPVSGLQQIFISRKYTGYFIELITRSHEIQKVNFTTDNMRNLSHTIKNYV